MPWNDNLLEDQERAAGHTGHHARLLAGPGTGKTLTLTRHICFLVEDKEVSTDTILAFTFTRAAARELNQRVTATLGKEQSPRISTLHSFALRQLLRNEAIISSLPKPLRIADDWEERNIVVEDLKAILQLGNVREASDLLNELSADWQRLTADESDWEKRFPNPAFLGAWREHRQIYGYTLRSELVYQLKKVLEQRADFQLESPINHLLVDEYQDLNRCDLAVVQHIELRGAELFIAGDDDQSIYGFRKAHPDGIRRFPEDYHEVSKLELLVCKRCDQDILALGLFVAQQDPRRVGKLIQTECGAARGEVALLRFDNQFDEARGIADICGNLMTQRELKPSDILILLRTDRNGLFSGPIRDKLSEKNIPVVATTNASNPLDGNNGRAFLAFLQLAASQTDNLAWRSLLETWCNGIGPATVGAVYDFARGRSENFAQAILAAHADSSLLPTTHRSRLSKAIGNVMKQLDSLFPEETREKLETCNELMKVIYNAAQSIVTDGGEREAILLRLKRTAEGFDTTSISELVRAVGVADDNVEQDLEENKVNILTMHRAKGLTAEAVIIVAAEDEYIPGRAQGEDIDDERRLLYVSLTRAKHHLFATYCDKRTGQQSHTGRNSGKTARSLSQFLVDCPHAPQDGKSFIANLGDGVSP